MTIETVLLILESVLLVVTIILLLYSIKEGRVRKDLLAEVGKATKILTAKGIKVKYLMPKFHDRLHIGYLYTKVGAEVRYSICAIANNIRYIIIDDRFVVIGIPESVGEKEAKRKGYRILSEGLASILKDHFYGCWDQSTLYEEYVKEVIRQIGATPKVLETELHINKKELERLAAEM